MNIRNMQIVDLSHPLFRRKEHAPYDANCTADSRMSVDDWCVNSICTLGGHAGTHVVFPYNRFPDGRDCLTYPLDGLIGEAVVMDLVDVGRKGAAGLDDVKRTETLLRKHDSVFLAFGMDAVYRESGWDDARPLAREAFAWLLSFSPKALGTDAAALDVEGMDRDDVYRQCFANGTVVVESLANLRAVHNERVAAFILPPRMQRMDASPARVIALKTPTT